MRALNVVPHAATKAWPHPLTPNLGGRDLLSVHDLNPDEVEFILYLALRAKAQPNRYKNALLGREMALLFEKPSNGAPNSAGTWLKTRTGVIAAWCPRLVRKKSWNSPLSKPRY